MKKYTFPPAFTLHRYWMSANKMRQCFEKSLGTSGEKWLELGKTGPLRGAAMFMCDEPGIFMSHWYGSLSAVIDGWRTLKLKDSRIDLLLQSPHVRRLKEFRNGAFHFLPEFFSPKFAEFMRDASSVAWVREITSSFGEYFLKYDPDGNLRAALPGAEGAP
jgi:hypothetical protein